MFLLFELVCILEVLSDSLVQEAIDLSVRFFSLMLLTMFILPKGGTLISRGRLLPAERLRSPRGTVITSGWTLLMRLIICLSCLLRFKPIKNVRCTEGLWMVGDMHRLSYGGCMHLHLISSEGVSNFLSLNRDLLLSISTNILFIFGAPATRRLQIIEDGRVDFHARFLFDHLDCHTLSLVSDIVYPISLPVFNILGCSSSFICDLFSGSCRNCSLKYPLIAINIIIAELKRDFLGFICYLLLSTLLEYTE